MRKFLGEILLEMEAVTDIQVKAALNKQNAGDKRMIAVGMVTLDDPARAVVEVDLAIKAGVGAMWLPAATAGGRSSVAQRSSSSSQG